MRRVFEELLDDQSDGTRVRSLYYLSKYTDERGLEDLLSGYLSKESYYYNVVTWLDRLLYSSLPLKEMFTRELEKEAR